MKLVGMLAASAAWVAASAPAMAERATDAEMAAFAAAHQLDVEGWALDDLDPENGLSMTKLDAIKTVGPRTYEVILRQEYGAPRVGDLEGDPKTPMLSRRGTIRYDCGARLMTIVSAEAYAGRNLTGKATPLPDTPYEPMDQLPYASDFEMMCGAGAAVEAGASWPEASKAWIAAFDADQPMPPPADNPKEVWYWADVVVDREDGAWSYVGPAKTGAVLIDKRSIRQDRDEVVYKVRAEFHRPVAARDGRQARSMEQTASLPCEGKNIKVRVRETTLYPKVNRGGDGWTARLGAEPAPRSIEVFDAAGGMACITVLAMKEGYSFDEAFEQARDVVRELHPDWWPSREFEEEFETIRARTQGPGAEAEAAPAAD